MAEAVNAESDTMAATGKEKEGKENKAAGAAGGKGGAKGDTRYFAITSSTPCAFFYFLYNSIDICCIIR